MARRRKDIPVIRTAKASDLLPVRALLIETWHAAYDGILGNDEVEAQCAMHFSRRTLKRGIAEKAGYWFGVAEVDGAVRAVATVRFGVMAAVKLEMLYVHPDYQRRGLGRAFIAHIVSTMPWARTIHVEALEPNMPAMAFYRSLGFEFQGTRSDRRLASVPVAGFKLVREGADEVPSRFAAFLKRLIGRAVIDRN